MLRLNIPNIGSGPMNGLDAPVFALCVVGQIRVVNFPEHIAKTLA